MKRARHRGRRPVRAARTAAGSLAASILRPVAVLLAAAALAAVTGCEEEPTAGDQTTITGRVVDPDRVGIYDALIAVVYFEDLLSGAVTVPVANGAPELLPPYPNPTRGLDGLVVTLGMSASADTSALLEIWSDVYGPFSRIREIHRGAVPAGETSWTWDHTDQSGDPLPNGVYVARLTLPASGDSVQVRERSILLSRPAASIFRRPEYNVFSDPSGIFTLENVAVGRTFTLTASSGEVLGTGVVRSRVDLVFREVDYVERIVPVTIPAGGLVDLEVIMEPLFSGRTPPDSGS